MNYLKMSMAGASAALVFGATALWWPDDDSNSGPDPGATPAGATRSPAARRKGSPQRSADKAPSLIATISDPHTPWQDRVRLVRESLTSDLSAGEVDACFEFLSAPAPAADREGFFVTANEVMEIMRKRDLGADRYAAELSALIKNPTLDPVIRDYAIQHLSIWISSQAAPGSGSARSADVNCGLDTISSTISDASLSHTTIPGTALMALADLSTRIPTDLTTETWVGLETALVSWFDGSATAPALPNQISALQALSRVKRSSFLPIVRNLADDPAANPSLRLSAVAALGNFGDPADRTRLESIARSNDRLRYAATAALDKLKQN